MESYYFIYTRSLNQDYQAMYFPSEEQCPRVVLYEFMNLARGAINTDSYSLQLDRPVWLLAQLNGYTLWGMGILNKFLNPEYANDRVGSQIRGFYGLIYKGRPQSIPYDIMFFKHIYDLLIVPNWNADAYHCFHEGVVCDVDYFQYTTITAEDNDISLNTLSNKTLILGDVDVKKAISQTMYIPNTGIIVGLQEEAHAFSGKYKYLNVWIEGHARSEYTYPKVKAEEKGEGTDDRQNDNPWGKNDTFGGSKDKKNGHVSGKLQGGCAERPKKAIGSKGIKVVIVLLTILLGFFLLMKACHANKPTPSSQVAIEHPVDTTNQK